MKRTLIQLSLCFLFIFFLTSCPEELLTPENEDDNTEQDDIDNEADTDTNTNTDTDNDVDTDTEIDTETKPEINFIDKLIAMINEQEGTLNDPALIKLEIDLGNMSDSESNWKIILKAIETVGKYVALDLSDCELGTLYFFPDHTISTGKNKIISLILPGTVTEITGGTGAANYAFMHFSNLKDISGENIIHIGNWAFYDCAKLEEVNFPKVTEINLGVFYDCVSLKKADFPEAIEIISNAFRGCESLVSVNAQKAEIIGTYAFSYCENLTEINLPIATIIYENAFRNCKSLVEVNFPSVEVLGNEAFRNCISIIEVEFPLVKIINPRAFYDCKNLNSVKFASAEKIGNEAFRNCINLETAEFLGNPEQITFSPDHPLDPWRNNTGSLFTDDCFVIYDNAFYGCKSLKVLDIRNAWNIYFAGGCLADIGTHLDMYLFDDNGEKSYGHPTIDFFLGGGNDKGPLTLSTLKIFIPQDGTKVQYHHPEPEGGYHGIAVWVAGILKIPVTIERLP